MKDSTLIIIGMMVFCLCVTYLFYYGVLKWKNRFNHFFQSHNMVKSTLAMAAAVWGFIALLVVLVGVVNGGMPAIETALALNGLLAK